MDLLTPSAPGGLPTLSVTTNSSWLPWGRVAMPLISSVNDIGTSKGPDLTHCDNGKIGWLNKNQDRENDGGLF